MNRNTIAAIAGVLLMAGAAEAKRPNFVFLLVDDMGSYDLGCYGSAFHESPNIDRLAERGVRFVNAFASHPVCGPSRAGIVMGKFPVRTGNTRVGGKIPEGETIWPKVLKEAGYVTYFTGKWHLGGPDSVRANGFDYNVGGSSAGAVTNYEFPFHAKNKKPLAGFDFGQKGDYLTDVLADKALDFLDRHGVDEKPFLLYFSFYNVHKPNDGQRKSQGKKANNGRFEDRLAGLPPMSPDEMVRTGKAGGKTYTESLVQRDPEFASQIFTMDQAVGRILAKVRELGVADNTIFIITSDQGSLNTNKLAVSTARPFRCGKGFHFDGGLRVPLVIMDPRSDQKGLVNESVTINTDIYPTVLDLAGLPQRPGQHSDGISLAPCLSGKTLPFDRTLFWAFPAGHGSGHVPSVAVRRGDYKLIYFTGGADPELYNLAKDVSESNNLAPSQPERVSEMIALLNACEPMQPILHASQKKRQK